MFRVQDVIKFAQELLDWDEEKTRRFMRANGITFFPTSPPEENVSAWCTCAGLIRLQHQVDVKRRQFVMPKACPQCGSPIEWDHKRDGMYGFEYGWRCLSGKPCFTDFAYRGVWEYNSWSYEI